MKKCMWRCLATAIVIAVSWCALAEACNVPVFRFALERWRPDPYRVVLFHRGELSAAERELFRPFDEQQDKRLANVAVRAVDLDDKESSSEEAVAERALYVALGEPALPWLVIQYPSHLRIPKPAWAGPLKAEVVAAAIDSPIRRELASRLAEGQTAVWLLLESGQPAKDEATLALLEEQLRKLEQQLELPELTTSPDDALATTLPLLLKFSVLRVPREVAAEHALVAMLIGSEPDLADRADPMVFPVFGKGRALLPLIGAGISAKNIHDAAAFLAGPCSCEVKEQNPGFDLLLAADWEGLLAEKGVSLTAIETRAQAATGEAELVPIPSGGAAAAVPAPMAATFQPVAETRYQFSMGMWVIVGVMGIIGIVLVGGLVVAMQTSGAESRRD